MSKPGLILIGAGGHAHACIDAIESHGQYRIAGLIGRSEEKHTRIMGYEVIATDEDLPALVDRYPYALITVGQILSPKNRIDLFKKANDIGFLFPVIVARSAHVSRHAVLGDGCIVMTWR